MCVCVCVCGGGGGGGGGGGVDRLLYASHVACSHDAFSTTLVHCLNNSVLATLVSHPLKPHAVGQIRSCYSVLMAVPNLLMLALLNLF